MTDDADLAALTEELAALRARVDELTAAAAPPPDDPAVSRRHLLRTLAGLGAAGAATAAGIATADPAAAADGEALILGQDNASDARTSIGDTDASPSGSTTMTIAGRNSVALVVETASCCDYSPNDRSGFQADASDETSTMAILALAGDSVAVNGLNSDARLPAVAGTNYGTGPGLGGWSAGGGPQLYLYSEPGASVGPPPLATDIGLIRFDPNGDLWLSVEAGDPGMWTRLLREDTASGRVMPITPMRVLDTRTATGQAVGGPVVPGQVKGPLKGGQTVTLDLAGITPIPATATGIIGNAKILSATANGYLRILPAGATTPAGTVDFTTAPVNNAFTSALNPTGLTTIAPISTTITYHLVLDITAYIT